MKVYVEYTISNKATGGGNQFIRNLSKCFIDRGLLTPIPSEADVILYNGHQNHHEVHELKRLYPDKIFIHRMDGLQKLYNSPTDTRQDIALAINLHADGTIFQSNWARRNFIKFGFNNDRSNTVIHNAADPELFKYNPEPGATILTTSWSTNIKKGFNTYKYLDNHLDFSKFTYYFIGNSPIKFKNIQKLNPMYTSEIANFMKKCNIFVSAVKQDACSNSIIEALTAGLTTFVYNSGGNSELVKNKDFVFTSNFDLVDKLNNFDTTKPAKQDYPKLDNIATQYIQYMENICGSQT